MNHKHTIAPNDKNTLKLAVLTSMLLASAACADDPVQETGFHEINPSSFDYFVSKNQQCASTEPDGSTCSYAYDDIRRVIGIDCPETVRVTLTYDDHNLVRTTRYEEYQDDQNEPLVLVQTNIESFTLEGAFVSSVEHHQEFTNRPDVINSSFMTTSTYARDADHRVERITMEGSVVGVQDFTYSPTTEQLISIASSYDEQNSDTGVFLGKRLEEFSWSGDNLTSVRTTYADRDVSEIAMSYDDFGRLATSIEGAAITTNHFYDCDEPEAP